jgi:hypothetical protein
VAANVNCLLSPCAITAANVATGATIVSTSAGSPQAGAGVVAYDAYSTIPNSPTSITLPTSPVFAVYIRNLGSTNNLLVTLTPTGGSAWASPIVLLPGAVFILWVPYTTTPSSGGFTALSLQGGGGSTTAEIFLAG